MAGLYAVEIEPEARTWLEQLTDRDFGRVDFPAGFSPSAPPTSASPTPATSAARSANCGSGCWPPSRE
jgi:hypothetical protein